MIAINFFHAVLLGIVQGITEFLPVSSSGHLVIVPALFGIPKPPLTFDVLLHLGTGVAVAAVFKDELLALVKGICKGEKAALRLAGWLVVGTIPAVLAGFLLRDQVEKPSASRFFGFSSWSRSCSGWPIGTTGPRTMEPGLGRRLLVGFSGPALFRSPGRGDHYRRPGLGFIPAGGGQVLLPPLDPDYFGRIYNLAPVDRRTLWNDRPGEDLVSGGQRVPGPDISWAILAEKAAVHDLLPANGALFSLARFPFFFGQRTGLL